MGMKLIVNKKILADNVIVYDNFFMKFFGLRFSKKLKNEAILFVNKKESRLNSIVDMFFVKFPLDVLWLDKNMKVVDKATLRTYTFRIPKRKAMYIVEIESGKTKEIRTGDKIKIE